LIWSKNIWFREQRFAGIRLNCDKIQKIEMDIEVGALQHITRNVNAALLPHFLFSQHP
jgi:hypothetical protein